MFASAYLNGIDENDKEGILSDTQAMLESTNCRNGSWYADYKRLRMVAVKQVN